MNSNYNGSKIRSTPMYLPLITAKSNREETILDKAFRIMVLRLKKMNKNWDFVFSSPTEIPKKIKAWSRTVDMMFGSHLKVGAIIRRNAEALRDAFWTDGERDLLEALFKVKREVHIYLAINYPYTLN